MHAEKMNKLLKNIGLTAEKTRASQSRRTCGAAGGHGKTVVIAAFLAAFSACTPAEVAIVGSSSAINYMETKKTFADQMISGLFQKDCAFGYYQEIDKLCKDAVQAAPDAPLYCYQSLGGVDCYAAPGPYDPRRQPLGGMAQQNRQKKAYTEYLEKERRETIEFRQGTPTPKFSPPPDFLEEEMEPDQPPPLMGVPDNG